ncbi:MAG: TrkH family potassium uptake protein [Aurantimonas endophytica]|uniref:Trk system potassium uptake protein n=1 Tax=Aurantimonas endophytica TaxID=1522175 RepID=A0A7W6H9V6_9HYPH|nr:TrkH family potassium uptake protein [Aurantimonas endophytica]MBB4001126.1 trk system potassium uptake protein TrkH [Aurantimonas endophytica]MCO6403219.1 TrkH family potassium uptake protein [Aurantimonas endophytica]
MMLPALVDLADNNDDWRVFVGSGFMVGMVCVLIAVATRGERPKFTPRLGFLLVTTVWLFATVVGSLPIYFSSVNVTYAGAFFEAMSGLTTTGSTVISGLDALPPGILLWRSLLQWLGGIGIIGMVLLILPSLQAGGMALFHMESSDKSDKVLPRVNQLTGGLITAYVTLTMLCAAAYTSLGMSFFDAINHAMTTLSTGGYSTHDASMGYFEDNRILVASTLFMILGALPFVIYIKAFLPRRFQLWRDPQILVFLMTCLVLSFSIAVTRRIVNETPFGEALISSAFNLVSVITTTGYASDDYTLWSNAAIGLFFLATFLGGCAGSTSGGIKANRLVILYLVVRASFRRLVRPHSVIRLKYGNDDISTQTIQTVTIFFFLYFGTLLMGTVLLTMIGLDLITAFSGCLTAISNVGPGFGQIIGPAGNFASLPDGALWVLSAVMLLGRLELVTVLILLFPSVWMD